MKYTITLLLTFAVSVISAQTISFSEDALSDTFIAESGSEITFSEVLKAHHGKTIMIDIWANWCRDCIKGMPDLKKLQAKNEEVVFVFLSLDKTKAAWKKGIDKYELEGEHYFLPKGWKSPFCDAIELDWIPRYMVVNPQGKISLYRAIKVTDKKIKKSLSK